VSGRPPGVVPRSEIRRPLNIRARFAIGPEHPVLKKVDHSEIAVRMQMMVDEMKLPLAPEPREAFQTRSLDVILLVDIEMRIEPRRTSKRHRDKID
jgi:hypothetical protein